MNEEPQSPGDPADNARGEPPHVGLPERENAAPAQPVLCVRLGRAEFGFRVAQLREVLRTPPITPVPFMPRHIAGVTSVRGAILPVVDLGIRLLGRPAVQPGRLVVTSAEGADTPVALLVDALTGVLYVTDDEIRVPPPEVEDRLPSDVVVGLVAQGERLVSLLAVPPILFPETSPV